MTDAPGLSLPLLPPTRFHRAEEERLPMKTLEAIRRRLAGGGVVNEARLIAKLSTRSQVELKEIEDDERANEARPKVLDKLRYLRGNEPVKGYDELEAEEVGPALADALIGTLDAVREYERKFQRRTIVLDAVADLRRRRGTAQESPIP